MRTIASISGNWCIDAEHIAYDPCFYNQKWRDEEAHQLRTDVETFPALLAYMVKSTTPMVHKLSPEVSFSMIINELSNWNNDIYILPEGDDHDAKD